MTDDRRIIEGKESTLGTINRYHLLLSGFDGSKIHGLGDLATLTRDQMYQLLHQKLVETDASGAKKPSVVDLSERLREELAQKLVEGEGLSRERGFKVDRDLDVETSLTLTRTVDFVIKSSERNLLAVKIWRVNNANQVFSIWGEIVALIPTLQVMSFEGLLVVLFLRPEVSMKTPQFGTDILKGKVESIFGEGIDFDVIHEQVDDSTLMDQVYMNRVMDAILTKILSMIR